MADEASEREERRRRLLVLLLILLMEDVEERGTERMGALAGDASLAAAVRADLHGLLVQAHAHAAYAGRMLAGMDAPFGEADLAFGRAQAAIQMPYLEGFIADVAAGKLSGAQIKARVTLYAKAVRGTANEAWARALPPDTRFWWVLGHTENHCGDCPDLAGGSPYLANTLPCFPGDGHTECLGNCDCHLATEDGRTSFAQGDFDRAEAKE